MRCSSVWLREELLIGFAISVSAFSRGSNVGLSIPRPISRPDWQTDNLLRVGLPCCLMLPSFRPSCHCFSVLRSTSNGSRLRPLPPSSAFVRPPADRHATTSASPSFVWHLPVRSYEVQVHQCGDMDIEILAKSESVKYLGQRISFYQQETIEIKSRIRAAWTTFRKYRQELTSKKYMLKLRLRLFDATVSPTLCYASGTWSPSREHERMIQSTQRKMLRLIIQTKRKYKKIEKQVIEHKIEEENDDKTENCSTDDKSGDDQSTKSEDDMDSGVTFDEDSEKDIDTAEIEEEDWFDYIRRSTADAIDRMDHAKIRCWNRTHKKMKWKLASRIATSPSERWVKKAAEWNPEMSSKYRTSRMIGRPKKRWEDDINDFLKQNHDERKTDEPRERRIQNNNMWIKIAIDRKEWTRLEEKYTLQSAK